MSVFRCLSYKVALSEALLDRKKRIGRQYTFQKMAEFCGLQKTYLSKVLNHDAHLNEDQLFLACEFLGFLEDEFDYCALLLAYEKTMNQKRKHNLKRKIDGLQNVNSKTEGSITSEQINPQVNASSIYHLDPNLLIIHMYLTIPRYQQGPTEIAQKINISPESLTAYLLKLEGLGIIKLEKGGYRVLKDNVHLSDESDIYPAYRSLVKIKTLERLAGDLSSSNYCFNVFFSSDEVVKKKIQALFLEYLKQVQKLVNDSESREVYQMSFDLINW